MPLDHEEFESEGHPPDIGSTRAANQRDRSGHDLPPIVAPPQTSQSLTPQNPSLHDPSKWRENLKLGMEFVGLTALIVYTFFSVLQWAQIRWTNRLTREALDGSNTALQQTLAKMQGQINEMHTQAIQTTNLVGATQSVAQTSHDTLVTVQRAFVSPYINYGRTDDPFSNQPISMNIGVKWENSGITPTKSLAAYDNWVIGNQVPNIYKDMGDSSHNAATVLGPKGSGPIFSKPVKLSFAVIEAYWKAGTHLYLWGWAKYRDVFKGTPAHITRYCYDITFAPIPNASGTNTGWTTVNSNCPQGNCWDEECQVK
jgi:hypothetical protein